VNPRWAVASRVLAAILGSLVLASASTVCAVRLLPDSKNLGIALGVLLLIPAWVALMTAGLLARSATRAWVMYLGLGALLAAAAWWP
jgi:hypothetical protein